MPQLNIALLDTILGIIFVFLIVNDFAALLDQLDDELVVFNNSVLLI